MGMFMILNNFVQSARSTKNTENTLTVESSNKKVTKKATEVKEKTKTETSAKKEDSNATKSEASAKALTAEQKSELAKAREEGKQEALKMDKKVDKEVAKRLSKMKMCKASGNDTNANSTKNRLGGTEVFKGKINATNALGIVGYTNWSINEAPYKVERCDQILLIKGKKLNMKDYCEKTDAFMTMSIYMINFFLKKDVKTLIESFSMADVTSIPSEIAGTTGCTMWTTKHKSFPFCYESREILDQVTAAYYKFLNCKNPKENNIAYMLKQNCDLAKMNLTQAGPFGVQGPMFKDILMAMDPNLFKVKAAQDLTAINPYCVDDDKARVPGDHLPKPLPTFNGKK